jgi:hypothetical protein
MPTINIQQVFVYYKGQKNTDEAVRRLAEVVRRRHLPLATERTWCAWLTRYCDLLKGLPLHLPSQHKLERFLTVPTQKDVAASPQNQAFNAIIFFWFLAVSSGIETACSSNRCR